MSFGPSALFFCFFLNKLPLFDPVLVDIFSTLRHSITCADISESEFNFGSRRGNETLRGLTSQLLLLVHSAGFT